VTPEEWERVRSRLEEALNLPQEERTAFIEQACADDPIVRRELLLTPVRLNGHYGQQIRPGTSGSSYSYKISMSGLTKQSVFKVS
jgi:hypothetical protein